MKNLLIEPHYAGCLEYFCLLQKYDQITFEVCDSFKKQTYRNRMSLLGSNKVLSLSTPVHFSSETVTKDVRINYSERWAKDHWGAFYSSYGKAPFFEFFEDEFKAVWDKKWEFLVDLNHQTLNICMKVCGIQVDLNWTDSYQIEAENDLVDFRNAIQPKIAFSSRNIYTPRPYSQLFGDSFVPNLSIIDLIMCEGPRASEILAHSYRGDSQV